MPSPWKLLAAIASLSVLVACGSADRWINAGYSAPPLALSDSRSDELVTKINSRVAGAAGCFANAEGDKRACQGLRNRVMSLLMYESVALCTEHLNSIYGREASFNIATGSLAALASGFAAVSTGGQASSLSALSAFASAERSLVNETVYKNMLTTAVGTKISETREEKGRALLSKKRESFDVYGMEDAIHDVLAFHSACSFREGLQLALAEGTQTTPAVKRAQLDARAIQLRNQIAAYTRDKQGPSADVMLKSDGTPATTDPILKGWIEEYTAVNRAIMATLPEGRAAPAPAGAASAPKPK